MNQNITLSIQTSVCCRIKSSVANCLFKSLQCLASYYGQVLERDINVKQTLHLLHAQVAFIFAAFASCSFLIHAAFAGWFLYAIMRCRKALAN